MKKLLSIILLALFVVLFSESGFAGDYNFRKTKWGMSIAQVKSSEPLEASEESENILGYKTQVLGKNVLVAYFFIDNQLVRTRYILVDSHTNKNDFITDYNDFKEILTKKYGKPKEDESYWKNDLYKDNHSHWGTAISMGHLVYISNWETKDTEINNILTGENFNISCIVEYSSKNLEELEKKAQEKKNLEVF